MQCEHECKHILSMGTSRWRGTCEKCGQIVTAATLQELIPTRKDIVGPPQHKAIRPGWSK